jgi:hypothetical protein
MGTSKPNVQLSCTVRNDQPVVEDTVFRLPPAGRQPHRHRLPRTTRQGACDMANASNFKKSTAVCDAAAKSIKAA